MFGFIRSYLHMPIAFFIVTYFAKFADNAYFPIALSANYSPFAITTSKQMDRISNNF